ncbi:MAG: helix-turn-helix domain-containing protein [Chitinophagaceae bacterium]
MFHQEFESPDELQDVIKCFWYNKQEFGQQPTAFEVIPDGFAEIIFHFGGGCSVDRDGSLQPLPSPFLVGLLNQPILFYSKNQLEIIAVRCFPWTVFDLLGLQPGEKGVHVFEHAVSQLQPILNGLVVSGKTNEAIETVKNYFIDLHSRISSDSLLYKAGIAMRKAKGTLPVSKVAASAHATVRTLERRFKQSSGHTVKDVSALMRFEQVRNHLWLHPDSNLAGLAIEMGYTDQAHLTREFKRYCGTTPAAFARKSKKGKQMVSSDFVAFMQA